MTGKLVGCWACRGRVGTGRHRGRVVCTCLWKWGVDGQVLGWPSAGRDPAEDQKLVRAGVRGGKEQETVCLFRSLHMPLPPSFLCFPPFATISKDSYLAKAALGVFRIELPFLPLEYFTKYPVNWFGLILTSSRTSHSSESPYTFYKQFN